MEESAKGAGDENESDIARLEAQLKDRGRELQELKNEVARRDLLVRELVATNLAAPHDDAGNASGDLPGVPSEGANGAVADLSARLDRLASEAAQREADLVASKWKIAQLEQGAVAAALTARLAALPSVPSCILKAEAYPGFLVHERKALLLRDPWGRTAASEDEIRKSYRQAP